MDLKALIDNGAYNGSLLEENYTLYLQNPQLVDPLWQELFNQLDKEEAAFSPPQIILTKSADPVDSIFESKPSFASPAPLDHPHLIPEDLQGHSVLYYPNLKVASSSDDERILKLFNAYRRFGHLLAQVNPLMTLASPEPLELKLETNGFSKQDLSLNFPTYGLLEQNTAPLLEIINALKKIYCGNIGVEFQELHSLELEQWIQQQLEKIRFKVLPTIEQKKMILQYLNKSELFESFLHTKYVGQKRFSLEGGETLIPMLASLIDKGAQLGLDEFIFGMAHRGRINVLSNIFNKTYTEIFSEFEEGYIPVSVEGSGDVKYHKGFYSEVKTIHGHPVKLTLTPNPSHLESVNAVVEGRVLARQIAKNDEKKEKVIPILIHGDAAIAGQGVVYEVMQLSRLEGYATGGTLHLVINNQIGFTTLPKDARSTNYCTDIAKIFNAPIFHVNTEDPEACIFVMDLVIEIRQKFHCDVFIELNCYRKYGHNEGDEPAFTQPLEYELIRKKKPIREIYRDHLIQEGVLEKYMAEALETEFKNALQHALHSNKTSPKNHEEIIEKQTLSQTKNELTFQKIQTGISREKLQEIGRRLCTIPEGLKLHPKLITLFSERVKMIENGEVAPLLDWGMAELLAYGSLLWEGISVRLSGQDICRGTFSHRHALLMDQVKEQGYTPLKHLKEGQGRFDIFNSPLSEYAVLGFEFGYSTASPDTLVIWEAQFGDFANGAQIIIDQFISSAEQKWLQKFGLTLLLPHGYEGQGPEHSSARIERFLTLCGDNNLLVVNPSTPAQFFHLLRRQQIRPLKKPLIVFTPKGLLRHPKCVSNLDELVAGAFQEIIKDPRPPKKTKRLVFCSGRIYYDLFLEREKSGVSDMMIVRIEQLYPLDRETIKTIVSKCSGLEECLWVQEEPSNMGAWTFIQPILRDLLPKKIPLSYVGRVRSASPATGSHAMHKKEHAAIMHSLFAVKEMPLIDMSSQLKA